MEILEIFQAFSRSIADVELFRSTMMSATNGEYRRLLEQKKLASGPEDLRTYTSMHSMHFQDATSGTPIFYGFRDVRVDDAIKNLVRHANRQHQWFLAESFELFEQFVKHAYAHMGFKDPGRWPLRDFGNARWEDVQSKGFEWYLEQAGFRKDAPLSILRHFSQVLPRMAQIQTGNRLDCDLLVAVTMIEHMRHLIVHKGGIVRDKKQFAELVVRKLGFNGSSMDEHVNFICQALVLLKSDGTIYLIDIPVTDAPGFRMSHDIFAMCIRWLLMYAHQVYLALGGPNLHHINESPPKT